MQSQLLRVWVWDRAWVKPATASRSVVWDDKSIEVDWLGGYTTLNALNTTVMNTRSISILFVVCWFWSGLSIPGPCKFQTDTLPQGYSFIYLLATIFMKKYRLCNYYQDKITQVHDKQIRSKYNQMLIAVWFRK